MAAGDNGSVPGLSSPGESSPWERLRRGLRGNGELPIGEALHPVALLATLVLVVNDWVLKPRYGPSAITGKLSDLAGLVMAPVILTAGIGFALLLARRLGARVDPYLSRRRLLLCVLATGAGFAAIKLSERAAGWFTEVVGLLRRAEVFVDPTDLFCLPALLIAWWIGTDELRRLGRMEPR